MLMVLLVANAAHAQQGQPIWTDILNLSGFGNMASGTYWQIGSSPQPGPIVNTNLTGISNRVSLSVSNLTGQKNQTGSYSCGHVVSPVSFIESNQGTGIKGVGFQGQFNAPAGGVPLTYQPNNNLFESVFFHEDPCYGLASDGVTSDGNPSREYGFFLAGSNSSIWVYWGTHENQPSVVQAQLQLPLSPNTQYFFEIYPTGNGASCGFQVNILNSSGGPVYNTWLDVNSNNFGGTITGTDSGFCGSVTAANGDTGYVSANIAAGLLVSGTLPPSSQLNTSMQRVFVGK